MPDAACPACRAPLVPAPSCPACGLRLVGPEAARLWQVDLALAELDGRRTALLAERQDLIRALRTGSVAEPAPTGSGALPETSLHSVQNTLLGLGALLLAVAATVFTAVTYERLGAGGRAAVLGALTLLAALAAPALVRRGLRASAETATAVLLVLGVLDAYGLRTLGIGASLSGLEHAAASAAVLAAAGALYAAAVPVRLAAGAAVAAAQLAALLLLVDLAPDAGPAAVALVALTAADLLVTRVPSGLWTAPQAAVARRTAAVCAAVVSVAALQEATGAALPEQRLGAVALVLLAVLSAAVALVTGSRRVRLAASAAPACLVALAGWSLVHPAPSDPVGPAVVAGTALAAALVAGRVPAAFRPGALGGALAVTAAALATQVAPVVEAVALPVTWLAEPWTAGPGTAGAPARSTLEPATTWTWTGSAATPAVLLLAAAALAPVGRAAGTAALRLATWAPPAAALTGLGAALVLPLGLDVPYAVALVLLLALAAATAAVARLLPDRRLASAGLVAAAAPGLLAVAWSTADRTATLAVLLAAAVLAAVVAGAERARAGAVAAAVGGLLGGAEVAASAAALGLSAQQVGALLVAAPAALLALPVRALAARRAGTEVAAALLAGAAVALARTDPGWLSWTLAALGLLALAAALRPDRRPLALLGAGLLSASSWVRLVEAGVQAPEPYVVPLGLLALALGHARRRREPDTRSAAAYGPGLSLLLLPSLFAALSGTALARPLLLGAAALAVLLVGVASRLRAPLAWGGAVLAVDALHLLAPYAAALPRWVPLGLAGVLLVGLGVTYEQRRADLGRLRGLYRSLA